MKVAAFLSVFGSCRGCRVAVCVVGHVRSFVQPHVRRAMRTRLVEALECDVETYFYLGLDDPVVEPRRTWDAFSRAPVASDAEVRAAAAEFPRPRLELHRGDGPRFVPVPFANALSQLLNVAACWALVEAGEDEGGRYDWVVRTRPDLAWVDPVPPLASFRADRVYVPAHYWPLADQVALVPRDLAPAFFSSIEALLAIPNSSCADWLVAGAGVPESALFRHLAAREIPVQIYDGFVYVTARFSEGANCATLHLARAAPCLALFDDAPDRAECQRALAAAYRERCAAIFPNPVGTTIPPPEEADEAVPRLAHLRSRLASVDYEGAETAPLVLTTSGWDRGRVVGQLAMAFWLRHEVRAHLAAALAALVDFLLISRSSTTAAAAAAAPPRNVSLALQAALVDDLWAAHVGTTRCIPACADTHVANLWETPRPLRLEC